MQRQIPGPGQESVWDYPRPPRIEPAGRHIRVELGGVVVAESDRALRVLETASPPVYYIPPQDVRLELLEKSPHRTFCEWKGAASYWTVRAGGREAHQGAWSYETPNAGYEQIRGCFAFYPARMDGCYVGEEKARPQAGRFYGGWVTNDVVGPFKGDPGTEGW